MSKYIFLYHIVLYVSFVFVARASSEDNNECESFNIHLQTLRALPPDIEHSRVLFYEKIIRLYDGVKKKLIEIGPGNFPVLSFDRTKIAYTNSDNNIQIFDITSEQSRSFRLHRPNLVASSIQWSPSDKFLLIGYRDGETPYWGLKESLTGRDVAKDLRPVHFYSGYAWLNDQELIYDRNDMAKYPRPVHCDECPQQGGSGIEKHNLLKNESVTLIRPTEYEDYFLITDTYGQLRKDLIGGKEIYIEMQTFENPYGSATEITKVYFKMNATDGRKTQIAAAELPKRLEDQVTSYFYPRIIPNSQNKKWMLINSCTGKDKKGNCIGVVEIRDVSDPKRATFKIADFCNGEAYRVGSAW